MVSFAVDLFRTLGTDWGMWLMFLAALFFAFHAFKWVFRIGGNLLSAFWH